MKTKKQTRERHKVGDVIYPNSNEGIRLRKESISTMPKNCWAVVTKVFKDGSWKNLRYMYNNETAELYGLILSGRRFFK